ncbi:sensor histidine kinase [Dyadobacter sp. CY356]|uniref:sensor histidine kinase n=1 Tax=Dyadobacter sp. CY356 TaxID=2906442 RepID=UPI001F2B2485|nr:histidine kinase [Dyadobacter sp. CY356]MCF0054777.1 sensor histidine kinase [Dyadobacter sp. CY356]
MAGRFDAFLKGKKRYTRVFLHVLVWLLMAAVIRFLSVGPLTNDNAKVIYIASAVVIAQSLFVFYFLGYFVFPRFLYKNKYINLIFWLLVIYFVIHLTNYIEFRYLVTISDAEKGQGSLFVTRFWKQYLEPGGLFGCFTNLMIAYEIYGWSLFYVTPLVAIKIMRDIIRLRTEALRKDMDQLRLERDILSLREKGNQLQINNMELEVNFLKSQINPHFLFNILNSIYMLTFDTDERAADLVFKLAELMRYSLYESRKEIVKLKDEINYIQNYLALEKSRKSDQVQIDFSVSGDLESHGIAPLLLISFIENAFKHGVNRSGKNGYVKIMLTMESDDLFFSIINSIPLDANSVMPLQNSGGLGIKNIISRLNLIYPNRHNIRIDQDETSFSVELRLTLQLL